jgi:putative addiction module killer protein
MTNKKELRYYMDANGNAPFLEWFADLKKKDKEAHARIEKRMKRVRAGNLGDCESVGNGVYELRFHFSPGYRIYFIEEEKTIILVLCGGDKSTQTRDIYEAKQSLQDLKRRSS